MRADIVIIFGPPGCGKSTHAEWLRVTYGCKRIVDNEDSRVTRLVDGDLYLTSGHPRNWIACDGDKRLLIVAFDDAVKSLGTRQ